MTGTVSENRMTAMKSTNPALRDRVVAAAIVNDTIRVCGGDLGAIHAEIARHEANGYSHLEAAKRATAPLWARRRQKFHHDGRRDCSRKNVTPG